MENLYIEQTIDTPHISFDKNQRKLELSGKSFPENTIEFYKPVLGWLDRYITVPANETEIVFKLKYFSSSSFKSIFDILTKLDQLKKQGENIKVKWYYSAGDTDMKETGEEFAELSNLDFSFEEM